MRTRLFSWTTIALTAVLLVSCGEDPVPVPVVEMFFEADASDPYTIDFTTTSSDATTFEWTFGDGETGVGESVSHTYAMSGDFTVTVTAMGEGGDATATKDITIAAGMAELLTGGPSATNGKTWILSRTATPGVDGAGSFDATYPADIMPGTDDLLDVIGLGDEYDNEYTFFDDGSYSINNVNGNHLSGWLFAGAFIDQANWVTITPVGIFAIKHTPPTDATWSLTEDTDLTLDGVNEDPDDGTITEVTETFTAADYITFTNGGFITIQDMSVYAIIRDISSTRLSVAVFMHSVEAYATQPSHILSFTFDAK